MLALKPTPDNPKLIEPIQLYIAGDWMPVYPTPVDFYQANWMARGWKSHGFTTLVKETRGGWMVYILGGAK